MSLGSGIAITGMWVSIAAVLIAFRQPILDGPQVGAALLVLALAVIGTVAISGIVH